MQENRNLHLLALSMTKGLGPVTVKNLVAYLGSARAVLDAPAGKLMKAPGVGEQTAQLVRQATNLKRAEEELAFCEKHRVQIINYLDPDYPDALKYISDAPLILFKKGNVDLNAQPNIAIVGTRSATDYGKEITERFATVFAQRGLNVVSGLAYGIDIAAHRAVLAAGGITTAVLGHGLDQVYPAAHARRAAEMLERGGLLTEYLTGTQPDAPHFPARNRIVSGICRAVVMIEAAESGGALITARKAFEQNREVYAIPGRIGDPYSQGCNLLIREHVARLVTSPEDVLEDLNIHWQQHGEQSQQLELALTPPDIPLHADEATVLNFLGSKGEATLDQIVQQTNLPIQRLNSLLLSMEFKELVQQMPGKKFRKR
ncbi:MAG: DNA-protecting protein DprA [Bacteroidetes bacterium]|nr:MAG: DNA-protecting protein DprA [Bacteroidota bacterium]